MTQREIARLCCKITAIYALIRCIESITGITSIFYMWPLLSDSYSIGLQWNAYAVVFFGAMPPVLLAAAATFFWRNSGVIAAWITGYNIQDEPDEPDPVPNRIDVKDLQIVAFATIGLWAIVSSISNLLNSTISLIITFSTPNDENSLFLLFSRLAPQVLVICLGFLLLFGAHGIVQLLYKLRNVGLEENDKSSSTK